MIAQYVFYALAVISIVLAVWQWTVARRFPLHQRGETPKTFPGITLLKPVKGRDDSTFACLRSWFEQDYPAALQILFGVGSASDPVCAEVERLRALYPKVPCELHVFESFEGTNAKVGKLALLENFALHDVLVISDADVRVPPDLLRDLAARLEYRTVGLVHCFYRLANPVNRPMRWEAFAINVDFWSQVLQSNTLKPMDFGLGAVMATRRAQLAAIGGLGAIKDCLADDYQLGNRIARNGWKVALSPIVVECWAHPMGWKEVWAHQLRWARTIRVCQPVPYFFSILSNVTLWPLVCSLAFPGRVTLVLLLLATSLRVAMGQDLNARLGAGNAPRLPWYEVLMKDLLQVAVWANAFLGNTITWRGQRMRLRRDGTITSLQPG